MNISGTCVLIIDADGQHRPADAVRLVTHLGAYDLVVGARSQASQASRARRAGNSSLNAIAGYLAGRPIPDLTSGFRAERLLDADDHDARLHQGRVQRALRAHRGGPPAR